MELVARVGLHPPETLGGGEAYTTPKLLVRQNVLWTWEVGKAQLLLESCCQSYGSSVWQQLEKLKILHTVYMNFSLNILEEQSNIFKIIHQHYF